MHVLKLFQKVRSLFLLPYHLLMIDSCFRSIFWFPPVGTPCWSVFGTSNFSIQKRVTFLIQYQLQVVMT